MKLVIISHTEHYKTAEGTLVGWGPTVTEINHLLDIFDEIYHMAMFYGNAAPPSAMPYSSDKITFVPIPTVGGKGLESKLKTLFYIPKTIRLVNKILKKVDIFQFRAPTGIGVYLIPYLTFFARKKGWFKYAGNWDQKHPPLGYRIQRSLLKQQKRFVTLNGGWANQPKHCLTFENPCLTLNDLEIGEYVRTNKLLGDKLNFCFVGRLEDAKGVGRILDAVRELDFSKLSKIGHIHFIGDGEKKEQYEEIAKSIGISMTFHGFMAREKVFEIYKTSHFFLLPSTASEGFPKVIAEAMNFGCVPIVSGVSAIKQYVIDGHNGFIVDPVNAEKLKQSIIEAISITESEYKTFGLNIKNLIEKFTYEYYNRKIFKELLN